VLVILVAVFVLVAVDIEGDVLIVVVRIFAFTFFLCPNFLSSGFHNFSILWNTRFPKFRVVSHLYKALHVFIRCLRPW